MPTSASRMDALPVRRSVRPSVDRRTPLAIVVLTAGMLLFFGACNRYRSEPAADASAGPGNVAAQPAVDHGHRGGSMGGMISSIGGDRYHAEAVLQEGGSLAVYVLAQDETRLYEVSNQVLTAYVKPPQSGVSVAIILKPDPLPGDPDEMTSRFSGQLPDPFLGQLIYVTIPGLRIDGERFTVRFQIPHDVDPEMPMAVTDDEAEELYLRPGGLYTEADIEANGRTTAAEKYAGFRAEHDANPAPGEAICPISRTKAHPQCSWIIGGETYRFCCPPCIDEFLALAKSKTEADIKTILPPDEYVQQSVPH